jgi:dimeric dUTPase (all-alpha-NTP-PPase superfamily)
LEYFTQRSLSLTFRGNTVERVNTFRFLGQVIDEELKFKQHIEHVRNKITPMIYAIKRIRGQVSKSILYTLYYAYIYCHLIFMSPLWGNADTDSINRLFVLQKKAIKIIENRHRLAPSNTLFSEELLPLPVLIDYNLLILAFKIKNNLIKNNVVIQYVEDIHRYNTRQRGDFYVYSYQTRYGYADFYKRGLIKYNELPSSIKCFHSLSLFKRRLREHLFFNFVSGN